MGKQFVLVFFVAALCLSCIENPDVSTDGYTSVVGYSCAVDASATSDSVKVAIIPVCYSNSSWTYHSGYSSDIPEGSCDGSGKADLALDCFYDSLDVVMRSFILKVLVGASSQYYAGWPLGTYPNSDYSFELLDSLGYVDQIQGEGMLYPRLDTGLEPSATTLLDDYDVPSAAYSVTVSSDDSVSIVLLRLRTYP